MKFIRDIDYEELWNHLEEKLNEKADSFDWEGATADDTHDQLEAYAKKELCSEILDLMDTLHRHA